MLVLIAILLFLILWAVAPYMVVCLLGFAVRLLLWLVVLGGIGFLILVSTA